MDNKCRIDWNSDDNKKSLIDATVNEIILKLYKKNHPQVVKNIRRLVRRSVNKSNK